MAPDGWPVFVVGRGEGEVEVFGAVAEVGPGRLGDEVGWCHVSGMFEATTRDRRYDANGRSVSGQGGLVRYDAEVVGGVVAVGARGDTVTGASPSEPGLPCNRRALLSPEYEPSLPVSGARVATQPVRVDGVLRLGSESLLCPASGECTPATGLSLADPLQAELGSRLSATVARTFWVTSRDGVVTRIAYGDVPRADDDTSEEHQFGYVAKVEGDWLYFDRAEILLGDAAVAAAKEDGKPVPAAGEHYLRNRNPRLRRYRVEDASSFSLGSFSGTGRAALPALRSLIGDEYGSLTLITRNGKLLRAYQELCGEG